MTELGVLHPLRLSFSPAAARRGEQDDLDTSTLPIHHPSSIIHQPSSLRPRTCSIAMLHYSSPSPDTSYSRSESSDTGTRQGALAARSSSGQGKP